MSIKSLTFEDETIFQFLEELATRNRGYIFRGHGSDSYRLQTTLTRLRSFTAHSSQIDDLIDAFRVGLIRNSIAPFETDSRLDWLEYARHHGVPTPVLDFTYSPYIALFFAFNGAKPAQVNESNGYVAIYAINIENLAYGWASLSSKKTNDHERISKRLREFMYPTGNLFGQGFPIDWLQFIPHPGKYNTRMHKQQGALLYDTLINTSLENLVDDIDESKLTDRKVGNTDAPTMYILRVKISLAREVFSRLELMGINGGSLLMDAHGVALDVTNSMIYHQKVNYLRDVRFARSKI